MNDLERIHTDFVNENGIVTDMPELSVETYYEPLLRLAINGPVGNRYLRVYVDSDGPVNIETRIPFSAMIQFGWTPPTEEWIAERLRLQLKNCP
jgi:hypothetical protein